jgi:hypothetical protein
MGLHCLQSSDKERQFCDFFGWGTAKSSIVLTDSNGEVVTQKSFCTDQNLSEKEWLEQEKCWINQWAERINKC